jgi:hypothetical protein
MYVTTILETRVGERVYKLEQTKDSMGLPAGAPARVDWRVEILADAGSYRAHEFHNTIIACVVLDSREKAVEVLNAVVTTALDTVASPFDV